MGSHPLNLALRFFLELAALAAAGTLAWSVADGSWRFVGAIGLPLVLAAMWGIFAVPDDPSRSGKAPVPIPGIVRLALELAFFGFACWALYSLQLPTPSLLLAGSTLLHYALSKDRIAWLLRQKAGRGWLR